MRIHCARSPDAPIERHLKTGSLCGFVLEFRDLTHGRRDRPPVPHAAYAPTSLPQDRLRTVYAPPHRGRHYGLDPISWTPDSP